MKDFLTISVLRTSFLLTTCCFLCQCFGSSKKEEPKATELLPPEANRIDAPQSTLFQEGKRLYSTGLHKIAKDSFNSLKSSYPIGPYAEFAEIKAADSEFELREYASAALLYEDFIKNHPGSEAIPYMTLQAGLSHLFSSRGVGRDITTLEKALEHFSKVVDLYPGSPYFDSGKRYKRDTEHKLAETEAMVRDFYKKQNKMKAYEARQKYFDKKWGNLSGDDDTIIPSEIHSVSTSPTNFETNSPPVIRAVSRVSSKKRANFVRSDVDLSGRVNGGVGEVTSERAVNQTEVSQERTRYQIHKVDCKQGTQKMVLLYLNKEFQEQIFIAKNRKILSEDGKITLVLPDTSFAETTAISESDDCFGSADLKLTERGKISLEASGAATLLTLSNPPRLALVLTE